MDMGIVASDGDGPMKLVIHSSGQSLAARQLLVFNKNNFNRATVRNGPASPFEYRSGLS